MKKVVAFLEDYAQWVALGVASLFFLYVVYSYILVGDQLKVKVGSETVKPEDVDVKINEYVKNRLVPATETPAGNLDLHVKDFAKDWIARMGPDRFPKEALASAASVRPPIPGVEFQTSTPNNEKVVVKALPTVPAPTILATSSGNSLVAQPPPQAEEGQDDGTGAAPQPVVDPAQGDPATVLANALDKKWIMVEGKVDTKLLADGWKQAFYKDGRPLPIPPEAMLTHFLQLEVVREEQTGPDTWGNSVELKPLPLVRIHDFPKAGDRKAEEDYRQWAETHQVDLVEPSFYTVLKGDPWYIPSLGAPKDPSLADDTQQPFDPANPTIPFDKMTLEQKRAVYLYKQEQKAQEQKTKAAERRSQTQSQESSRGRGGGESGGRGGGGGRRIGGYAPLPIQLAAGPGSDDAGRGAAAGRTGAGRVESGRGRGPGYDPRSRGRVPAGRDPYGRDLNRADRYRGDAGTPGIPQQLNGEGLQNQMLTGPFDPTRLPADMAANVTGKLDDKLSGIHVWAYDENIESGKTYRYKMRIKLKNPLYNTYGLAANEADASKFALVSDWSDWKTVTAPKTTEYFFTAMRQQLGGKNVITSVTASVFRHVKGDWTMQTFSVAPGDAIGGVKDGVDYSTGATLVDLRPDTRERDLRILVSDNVGNVTTLNYQEQLNNEYLKTLQDKVNKASTPAADGTQPAAAGNRALVNEVGGLR